MSCLKSPNNLIATIMKQATENCVRCGASRKATKSHEYYFSCDNCTHLCCAPHKPREANTSSRIIYESLWPHFLCGPCHHMVCSQGHGFYHDSCPPVTGICAPPVSSHHFCDICPHSMPCHCKAKKICKAESVYKTAKPPSPHIHVTPCCTTCRFPKFHKSEGSTHHCMVTSDHRSCICRRMGDPRDSGWIVHRE